MCERTTWRLLAIILILFVGLGSAYAITTPTLEAPDEIYHYEYIRSLVNTGRPPVLEKGGGRGFGHHAPLYYAYGALVSFWVGENDLEQWEERHNPFFGYRFGARGRDNKNLYLHPDDDALGRSDTWLGIRVVRLASVLLGAVTIWVIYRTGLEIFPQQPELALGAAGLSAFIPQFLFISGAVNDDNGATLFGSLALWAMMRMLRKGPNWRRCVGLGLALGLGWLSKLTIVALVPTAAVALFLAVIRYPRRQVFFRTGGDHDDDWRKSLVSWGLIVFGVAALFIVPWLVRQTVLYGDPTGTAREMSEWGLRDRPVRLSDLGPDLYWLRTSFWGRLGYNQIPLSDWIYDAFDIITLLAILGLIYSSFVIRHSSSVIRNSQFTILSIAFLFTLGPMIVRRFLRPMPNFGRYLFPILPAIALLIIRGLSTWLPRHLYPYLALGLTGAMLALGIAGLTCFLAPAYARPPIYEADAAPPPQHRLDWVYLSAADDQPLARLRGYDLAQEAVRPGETVRVTLHWDVLDMADSVSATNYILFAQLFGQGGTKVGQRDTYPGLGHYPTSFWQPGQVILDEVPIPVAPDAASPSRLRLDIGLYRRGSGRLKAVDETGQPIESATVGWLKLSPPEEISIADETAVNYRLADVIALSGYKLEQNTDTIDLTLHWECLAPIAEDYTIFVHLLDANDALAAQADGPPVGGDYPTSLWAPGEEIIEERTISKEGLPSGTYQVHVGIYRLETGERLPVRDASGNSLPNGAVSLTEVSLP
jgi:hypothetical protein